MNGGTIIQHGPIGGGIFDAVKDVKVLSLGEQGPPGPPGPGSDLPRPNPIVTGPVYTIAADETWVLFKTQPGGITLVLQSAVAGRRYRLRDVGQNSGPNSLAVNAVTLSVGLATYTVEDPVDPLLLPQTTATLDVPGATYEYALDIRYVILRCMRPVR